MNEIQAYVRIAEAVTKTGGRIASEIDGAANVLERIAVALERLANSLESIDKVGLSIEDINR